MRQSTALSLWAGSASGRCGACQPCLHRRESQRSCLCPKPWMVVCTHVPVFVCLHMCGVCVWGGVHWSIFVHMHLRGLYSLAFVCVSVSPIEPDLEPRSGSSLYPQPRLGGTQRACTRPPRIYSSCSRTRYSQLQTLAAFSLFPAVSSETNAFFLNNLFCWSYSRFTKQL